MTKPGNLLVIIEQLGSTSETFIARHVRLLNGGNVVAGVERKISTSMAELETVDRVFFQPTLGRRLFRKVLSTLPMPISSVIWRTVYAKDLVNKNIQGVLFEFGYLLVRNWDIALYSGIKFWVYFRGQDASRLLKDQKYVLKLRQLVPKATGVAFVADHLRTNLERCGVAVGNSIVLPSGVDTKVIQGTTVKERRIVAVGRLVKKKGFADLIKAFKLSKLDKTGVTLEIVGDGPLRAELEQSASDCRQIIFSGEKSHHETLKIIAASLCLVCSSKTSDDGDQEGLPNVILEAMAASCLPILSEHGDVRRLFVHGETCLLYPEGDFLALVKLLRYAFSDRNRESVDLIRNTARSHVASNYDYRSIQKKLEGWMHDNCC